MAEQVPTRPHTVYNLKHPLKEGREWIATLYILKPRGKEMRLLPASIGQKGSTVGDLHPFAAKVSGLRLEQFEELEQEDYLAVMAIATQELSEFPQTGPSASPSSAESSTSGETSS